VLWQEIPNAKPVVQKVDPNKTLDDVDPELLEM
jgi:hypothetical protein